MRIDSVWIVGIAVFLLTGCDRDWQMSGIARIPPEAFAHTDGPSIVCVGEIGPFGPEGSPHESAAGVQVFCAPPSTRRTFLYRMTIISGPAPRGLRAYAWLERHDELRAQCDANPLQETNVPYGRLARFHNGLPVDIPCHRSISPHSSIGFAVGFKRDSPDREDYGDIDVVPNGMKARSNGK